MMNIVNPSTKPVVDAQAPDMIPWLRVRVRVRVTVWHMPSGCAALTKAFAGNKFRPTPRDCGLGSGRNTPPDIF